MFVVVALAEDREECHDVSSWITLVDSHFAFHVGGTADFAVHLEHFLDPRIVDGVGAETTDTSASHDLVHCLLPLMAHESHWHYWHSVPALPGRFGVSDAEHVVVFDDCMLDHLVLDEFADVSFQESSSLSSSSESSTSKPASQSSKLP